MAKVKDRILENLAVRALTPDVKGRSSVLLVLQALVKLQWQSRSLEHLIETL